MRIVSLPPSTALNARATVACRPLSSIAATFS
jgi:hypothetical protein